MPAILSLNNSLLNSLIKTFLYIFEFLLLPISFRMAEHYAGERSELYAHRLFLSVTGNGLCFQHSFIDGSAASVFQPVGAEAFHVVSRFRNSDSVILVVSRTEVEDHNVLNGLGSAVCEVVAEAGKGRVKRIGIQDQFGQSAPYERLLAMNGVTVENIVASAEKLINA